MSRSVTVVFEDGTSFVYQDVPDNVTPDQAEARALRDFPDRGITEVMGGDIMLREWRDAIASRQATVDDILAIADRYGRAVPDVDNVQEWIDFAAAYPDFEIPEDIVAPPVSRVEAAGRGFMAPMENLATDVYSGIFRGLNALGLPGADTAVENINRARQTIERAREPSQQQRGPSFTGGQIAGEIAVTAPAVAAGGAGATRIGWAIASRAPTLGRNLQQFGRAVQSGGVGVRAPTMANRAAIANGAAVGGTRLSRLGLRAGGGATSGAGAAALTDQDLTDAALSGAIVPILGTITRRGLGYVYDTLRGRMGDVRAAEVFRNLIADNGPAITEALQSAPADVRTNTAQFLAERNLLTPELAAATQIAEASNAGKPLERVALARAAGREEDMATLRGGATQTEAVENINAMRTGVRNTAEPLRQNAMQEVNVGRTQIVPLENLSALLDDAAQQLNAGGQVRSMRGLEGRTLEQIDDVFAHPELYAPGTAGRQLPRLGEIADQAGQRADEGIDTQMFLRDEAARARTVAEDLRAQGYAPLDITPVVRRMRELAREALPNTGRRLLFSRYADMLEQAAAESGGIIDGAKLHMAKRELGDFVASVLGQSDPSAIQRGTSMMAGDVQNAIDAAFNAAAPGTPWAEYNRVFSGGMRGVEQQDFARELTQLSPVRFENVMRGGDIDFVRQHLPNDFDINSVLTPSQRETAQRLNRGISADLDVTNTGLRALGSEQGGSLQIGAQNRVSEAIEPGFTPTTRAIFNLTGRVPGVSGGGIAAEQTARQYAQNMSQNTMRSLVPALASAPAAARLLPVRSTNYMTARAVSNLDPITQQMLAQAAQRNMTGGLINTPAAEYYAPPPGQIIVGYGLTISGQRYPIYAPPGAAQ